MTKNYNLPKGKTNRWNRPDPVQNSIKLMCDRATVVGRMPSGMKRFSLIIFEEFKAIGLILGRKAIIKIQKLILLFWLDAEGIGKRVYASTSKNIDSRKFGPAVRRIYAAIEKPIHKS